jgi:hypothetical protein
MLNKNHSRQVYKVMKDSFSITPTFNSRHRFTLTGSLPVLIITLAITIVTHIVISSTYRTVECCLEVLLNAADSCMIGIG